MAEKEYIERDSLAGKLIEMKYCSTSSKIDFGDVLRLINSETAADVQEVRHGENVTPFHPTDEFICSECGIAFKEISEYIIEDDVYREFYFKFCPNCGAKMDKE